MKPLTPDKRAGLSVTGLLLLIFAVAICAASYRVNGPPEWPMRETETSWFGAAALAAVIGIGCLVMGTEESSKARK